MEEVCVKIIDGVYLGSYKTAMSLTTIQANKISHILCVGNEMENINKSNNQLSFMKLEVEDTEEENILFNFSNTFAFIEEGRTKSGVLIHCYGGISRSPTITMAYLMKKFNYPFDEAYNKVLMLKSDINPNPGFLEKLQNFEKIVNKPVENYYKCGVCRKTLFDDSNIDYLHEYTPKTNYSYKRFKKSFVNTNECSSYFLNNLDFINPNNEKGGKIMCPTPNVIFKLIYSVKIK